MWLILKKPIPLKTLFSNLKSSTKTWQGIFQISSIRQNLTRLIYRVIVTALQNFVHQTTVSGQFEIYLRTNMSGDLAKIINCTRFTVELYDQSSCGLDTFLIKPHICFDIPFFIDEEFCQNYTLIWSKLFHINLASYIDLRIKYF